MEESLTTLTKNELMQIAWDQTGVRVSSQASEEDIHAFLQYELDEEDLPRNPVNTIRETLINFINTHREQLSLPCNGNCFEHSDGTVMSCYHQFLEDRNGERKINEEMF